jgi:hypothetical protein
MYELATSSDGLISGRYEPIYFFFNFQTVADWLSLLEILSFQYA